MWICGEDCKPFIEYQSDTKIICHVAKNPREDDPDVSLKEVFKFLR